MEKVLTLLKEKLVLAVEGKEFRVLVLYIYFDSMADGSYCVQCFDGM